MSSWQMKVVALYVRAVYKRGMSTAERAVATMEQPKGSAAPSSRFTATYDVREEEVGGLSSYVVGPRGHAHHSSKDVHPRPTVVYVHGGAYIAQVSPAHWSFVARLVDEGCRVVVPVYGLAPEHTVDEAIDFITAVYTRLLETCPAESVAFAGDSAGAGLALAAVQTFVGQLPLPAKVVLISPWLDVTMSNPDIADLERQDPWLTRVGLVQAGKSWTEGGDGRDPHASPIFGDMAGMPPIEVVIGTRDLFHADTLLLAQRCAESEVACDLEVVSGAVHVFPFTPTPEGRLTTQRLVRSLASVST